MSDPASDVFISYKAEDRKRLFDILLDRSLQFGDFTLSSGAKSPWTRALPIRRSGPLRIAWLASPARYMIAVSPA